MVDPNGILWQSVSTQMKPSQTECVGENSKPGTSWETTIFTALCQHNFEYNGSQINVEHKCSV